MKYHKITKLSKSLQQNNSETVTNENEKKMPLINCEINLTLTWSEDCVISSATGATKSKITDTRLYVPVVTLLTQSNAQLLR